MSLVTQSHLAYIEADIVLQSGHIMLCLYIDKVHGLVSQTWQHA